MKWLLFSLLLFPDFLVSQADSAKAYYLKGLEAFKLEKYSRADSLFGLSIKFKPYGNVHLKMAIVKEKLGDKKGYCENLLWATYYNSSETGLLFCEQCGSSDTIYKNGQGQSAPRDFYLYKEVTFKSEYTSPFMVKMDTHNNSLLSNLKDAEILPENENGFIEENAEFPGGTSAMLQFIKETLKYPTGGLTSKTTIKLVLKFIVNENGGIDDVQVTSKSADCNECETEAIKVVKAMPKWRPAKLNGRPVKCYFNLPIAFNPS